MLTRSLSRLCAFDGAQRTLPRYYTAGVSRRASNSTGVMRPNSSINAIILPAVVASSTIRRTRAWQATARSRAHVDPTCVSNKIGTYADRGLGLSEGRKRLRSVFPNLIP
jgi:hypothetical protein